MNDLQLNGWKEIAAYLGKSPRAAQRWEQSLALPIRRIKTAKGGEIVYAVKSELEQWKLKAGRVRETESSASDDAIEAVPVEPTDARQPASNRRFIPFAAAAILLAALAIAASLIRRPAFTRPAATTTERQQLLASDAPSGWDPGPYPTVGHDSAHSNNAVRLAGPQRPSAPRLLFDTKAIVSHNAFAVTSTGTILLGSCGAITAVAPDGHVVWKQALARRGFVEEPGGFAVDANGRIYFATCECPDTLDAIRLGIYALLPTGEVYWHRQHGSTHVAPTLGPDGTIYDMDETNTIHAYAPDGTLRWATDLPGYSHGLITVGPDSTLTIGTDAALYNMTSLWRLDQNGRPLWTNSGGTLTTALLLPNGTAIVGDSNDKVKAVDRNGRDVWTLSGTGRQSMMPFAAGRKTIYVRSVTGLKALDASGKPLWEFLSPAEMLPTDGSFPEAPIVDRNDDLFMIESSAIVSLTSSGTVRWRVPSQGMQHLAVGAEGVLYAYGKGKLYVITDETPPR